MNRYGARHSGTARAAVRLAVVAERARAVEGGRDGPIGKARLRRLLEAAVVELHVVETAGVRPGDVLTLAHRDVGRSELVRRSRGHGLVRGERWHDRDRRAGCEEDQDGPQAHHLGKLVDAGRSRPDSGRSSVAAMCAARPAHRQLPRNVRPGAGLGDAGREDAGSRAQSPLSQCRHGVEAPDIRRRRADRRRRAGRRADDDQDRDREPRRDDGADRQGRRGRGGPGPRSPCRATRTWWRCGRSSKESPIPVIADIHFNHTLALKAIDAGAHCIRLNPGNIGGREKVAEVAERATQAGVPMRIGVNSGSLPKHLHALERDNPVEALVDGRDRVRRDDGVARLRGLQGLDQVDQRPQHDRRQPPARRADPVSDPPRDHRGGHEVVGVAEVRGRPRNTARRRGGGHDPHQPLDLPRRGGGQGRLGDPQGAADFASAARC